MKNSNKSSREFAISNKVLSVDLNVLNLLQMALLTSPTDETAVRLKRQFGIYYLTPQEILHEILNVNSPLHKYLVSLMMCMVARCMMLMKERTQHMIENENRLAEMKVEEILEEEEEKKHHNKTDSSAIMLRKELMAWERVISNILLVTSLPLQPFTQTYVLEAFKASQLNYYLGIVPSSMLDFVRDIIEQSFRMAKRDLDEIDMILQRANLTPEERNEVEEVKERYLQSIKNQSDPEKIAMILSHSPPGDRVVLTQHFWGNQTNVQVIFHSINKFREDAQKVHLSNSQKPSFLNKHVTDDIADKAIAGHESLNALTTKQLWKLKILQEKLSDLLTLHLDSKKEILIEGVDSIFELQNELYILIYKKMDAISSLEKFKTSVLNIIDILTKVDQICYSDIIEILKNWCKDAGKIEDDQKKEKKFVEKKNVYTSDAEVDVSADIQEALTSAEEIELKDPPIMASLPIDDSQKKKESDIKEKESIFEEKNSAEISDIELNSSGYTQNTLTIAEENEFKDRVIETPLQTIELVISRLKINSNLNEEINLCFKEMIHLIQVRAWDKNMANQVTDIYNKISELELDYNSLLLIYNELIKLPDIEVTELLRPNQSADGKFIKA